MKTGRLTLEELVGAFRALGGEADWCAIRTRLAGGRQHSIKPYKTKDSYEGSLKQLLYERCPGSGKYRGDEKFKKVRDSRYRLLDFNLSSTVSSEERPSEPGDLEDALRRSREISESKRDATLVAQIKTMYGSQCQLCRKKLRLPSGEFYAEAHHVRGLGDGGPDRLSNMLCVCPDCHALLDLKAVDIPRATLIVNASHGLAQEFLDWHNARYKERWPVSPRTAQGSLTPASPATPRP